MSEETFYTCDVCDKKGRNSEYFRKAELSRSDGWLVGKTTYEFHVCQQCWDDAKKPLFKKIWKRCK